MGPRLFQRNHACGQYGRGLARPLAQSSRTHHLSGLDGTVLQDTGVAPNKAQHVPDVFSLRLTVNVKFDLHGESPETARVLLMRLVDQAMLKGLDQSLSQATILNHQFEGSSLVGAERRRSSDTDFSQLLDI